MLTPREGRPPNDDPPPRQTPPPGRRDVRRAGPRRRPPGTLLADGRPAAERATPGVSPLRRGRLRPLRRPARPAAGARHGDRAGRAAVAARHGPPLRPRLLALGRRRRAIPAGRLLGGGRGTEPPPPPPPDRPGAICLPRGPYRRGPAVRTHALGATLLVPRPGRPRRLRGGRRPALPVRPARRRPRRGAGGLPATDRVGLAPARGRRRQDRRPGLAGRGGHRRPRPGRPVDFRWPPARVRRPATLVAAAGTRRRGGGGGGATHRAGGVRIARVGGPGAAPRLRHEGGWSIRAGLPASRCNG